MSRKVLRIVTGLTTVVIVASLVASPIWGRGDGGVQTATSKIAAAKQLPKFAPPGAPVDMASLKGKKVWILTSTLTVPFVANIAKGTQEAAKLAGWDTKLLDGKGSVTEWNRIMGLAIAGHADAIISIAASPELMKPQMAKAKAAGIPVIDVLTADKAAPLVPGTFSHVSISFVDSGALQSDYAIMDSKGTAHVLILGDNEFPAEVSRVKGIEAEFKKLCPKCETTFHDTQVGKLGTDLGPLTQTLLRKDPSINYVLPTYDAQALYIVPAIKQAGLANKVKVIGSDAVSSNLDWTAKNDVQIADVGEPDVWAGWASVDEMARGMLKMKAVDEGIPLRMFDASNLKGLNTKDENQLFGRSFRAFYAKLWGLKQ
jgi:ribose transport system substrate-binding protein